MTKDEFLALAASHYDDLQRLNTEQTNFYDYEVIAKFQKAQDFISEADTKCH